ncbi:MAG TPA: O-antigen ligase family protein [Pyrinomonadaceae bacterium]|nr:O-antigen ligase family protein [Pyrinomonadaceae bacterium]
MITDSKEMNVRSPSRLLDTAALFGFLIYAAAAPHSIAGSWAGISIVVLVWLIRTILTRRTGLKRTAVDLPLWLFIAWTVLSSLFSIEPRQSIPKLINVATFLMFYLAQALLTRRTAVLVASLMIISAVAGVLWGAGELVIGRGVVVAGLSNASPLHLETPLQAGDVVWRVNGERVSSAAEIDTLIRSTPAGQRARLSVISHGEHVEWPGVTVTDAMRVEPSPSGITGGGRSHSFRASGWTRHYETFAEVIQIIGSMALGFAVAQGLSGASAKESRKLLSARVVLPAIAFLILGIGIALTAMRTTLLAFTIGMFVIAWRISATRRQRLAFAALGILILGAGVMVVWRTRAHGALSLSDPSSSLRVQVAQIAARRVILHPLLGHGMDAMHEHWNEWGFPGKDMLGAHSTPIQIAFDRGLPALGLWLWLMYVFWRLASRTEMKTRGESATIHGLALGAMGGLAGFLMSSLVNYNFGDSEVALLFWWMMGALVVISNGTARPIEKQS